MSHILSHAHSSVVDIVIVYTYYIYNNIVINKQCSDIHVLVTYTRYTDIQSIRSHMSDTHHVSRSTAVDLYSVLIYSTHIIDMYFIHKVIIITYTYSTYTYISSST